MDASAEQRRSLQETNRRIRAEQGLLRVRQQQQSIGLARLREESGLLANVRAGTGALTRATNLLGGAFAALGIGAVTQQIADFATASVRAAAELQGYQRGLMVIEGSRAPERLQELIEVANLPGLQLSQLINFSNRLRAVGLEAEDVDRILLTTGQTILTFGGTSDTAAQAVEQITQAISTNTVSLQDFRSIAQRIPSFYQAIAETHDVAANIDGFRVAVDRAGGSVADALLPVMDTLARRFGSPPSDSYAVAVDALQNSFFLLQAEIGERMLPAIAQAANALSAFFDAIRENNLDALPEPIQRIVEGARNLYEGFLNVAENIRRGLRPEINQLLPVVGNLLGNILSLAGALADALAPAYQIVAIPTRIAIALVVHLTDTIGNVISAITDFVEFAAFWRDEQDQANTSTQNLTSSVGAATTVLNQNATATQNASRANQDFGSNLQTLQSDVANTRQRLDEKRQALQDLVDRGVNMAHPAVQQLNRQISDLESQLPMTTSQVDMLKRSFLEVEMPTQNASSATREFISTADEFGGALGRIDTRFLTYHERVETLTGAIRELPPAITAVRNEFDPLAATADRVNAVFEDLTVSVVDLTEEERALNLINSELHGGLTAIAFELETTAHNANLVNPAVNDAAESVRAYASELDSARFSSESLNEISSASINRIREFGRETLTTEEVIGNFALRLGETEEEIVVLEGTSNRLTESFRRQSGELQHLSIDLTDVSDQYSDLRTRTDASSDAIDNFADTLQPIPSNIDLINDAFDTFGRDTITILRSVENALGDLEGGIGAVATALGEFGEFAQNPVGFAADFFSSVIGDLIEQARGFGDETFQSPELQRLIDFDVIGEDPNLANIRSILERPEGLDFLTQNYSQLFADPAVEALIRELRPDQAGRLFDQEGLGSGRVVRFDPVLRESLTDLLAPGSEAGAPLGSRDPTAPLSEINETLRSIDEKTPDTGRIRDVSLDSDFARQVATTDRIFGDPEEAEAQAQASADAILMINEDLADRREAINDRLNDQLGRLAQDAVDAERDKLRQIEDLNIRHARSLERLRLGSSRRTEDIDIDLQRRLEDINIDAQRRIADVNDNPRFADNPQRRAREIAEIQERQQERIEDARLRASRDRADVQLRSQRAIDDLATQTAERIADRELRATRLQTSILESQQNARLQADTAHQQAQQEAQRIFQTQLQEILAAAQEAAQNARHERQLASTEEVEGVSNTNLDTRLGREMTSTLENADIQDTRLGGRLDQELSSTLAIEDIKDARHASRLQLEQMASETLQMLDETTFTPSPEQLNRLPNEDTGGANALYRDLSDVDYAAQVLADRADLNARREEALARVRGQDTQMRMDMASIASEVSDAVYQAQIDADRQILRERREAGLAERRGQPIRIENQINLNGREIARVVNDEIIENRDDGTFFSDS